MNFLTRDLNHLAYPQLRLRLSPAKSNRKLMRCARTLSNSQKKSKRPAEYFGAAIFRYSFEVVLVGVAAFIFAAEWLLGRGGVTRVRMRARGQPHKQRSFGCYVVCLRAAQRRVRQQPPHVLEVLPVKIGFDNRVTDSSESR